jgi:hypothetical protein
MASGILAWQWQLGGQKPEGTLLLHPRPGVNVGFAYQCDGMDSLLGQADSGALLPGYRLPLELVAALLIVFTGHSGGVLSGVNAPG